MAMAVAPAAMVKEEAGNWAKLCDSCRSAASAVYCRADSAYLCPGCDARVHAANWVASRHERVWVCEACECAPATLTCKADAASLCAACDAWIHSANPLAGRHCRLPISPISAVVAADRLRGASPLLGHRHLLGRGKAAEDDDDDGEDEVSSWLLLNPVYKSTGSQNSAGNSTGFLLGGEVDEYLDLVEYNSCGENQMDQDSHGSTNHEGSDSVVPHVEQCSEGHDQRLIQQQQQQQQQGYLIREMDQYEATKAGYKYNCAGSLTQSHVSFSSLDASSTAPDAAAGILGDTGNTTHWRPQKGTIDLFGGSALQMPAPSSFPAMDREARVHRYREKRKTRKFAKTIRYASRKAYAETRPRIKGRFAKRSEAELAEVDQLMFSSAAVMADSSYGVVVPSF